MANNAEERVADFYNTIGWKTGEDELTEDAKKFEDLRENAKAYVSKCRMRVRRHIPEKGVNFLDMASGPIQYPEYLTYSKNYEKRYCVDLSLDALNLAKKKIADHGVFLHGSFFDIPLEENFFDCSLSMHTIYHIHKNQQEQAVHKLLRVTKPGKPVLIVYSNPNTLVSLIKKPLRFLRKHSNNQTATGLYFFTHPLSWWSRFEAIADIDILPFRSFSSDDQKRLFPDNNIGKTALNVLFTLEERFPAFFAKHFQYPLIILTKKHT